MNARDKKQAEELFRTVQLTAELDMRKRCIDTLKVLWNSSETGSETQQAYGHARDHIIQLPLSGDP